MKHKPELNAEYPAPGEREITEKLIALLKGIIEQRYLTGTTFRDVHVKGHAGVRAKFIVEPNLPGELRAGVFRADVFKEPRAFPARIRFSDSSQDPAREERMELIEYLKDLEFPEKDYPLVAPQTSCP